MEEQLLLFLPLDLIDIIYDFTFYIKELFATNNYRKCARELHRVDNLKLTITQHKVMVRCLLGEACKNGNEEIIKLLLKRIKTYTYRIEITDYWLEDFIFHTLTFGYREASIKNNQKVIEMLNNFIPKNTFIMIKPCFEGFCAGGYLDKINLYFKKYPDKRINLATSGLKYACIGGYLNIVKILMNILSIETDDNLFKNVLYHAYKNNHSHITDYIIKQYNVKSIIILYKLMGACQNNNKEMVNMMCDKYPLNMTNRYIENTLHSSHWWSAFNCACKGGHLNMAIFVLKKYKNIKRWKTSLSQRNILASVYIGGNIDILKLVINEYKKIDINIDLSQCQSYMYTYANIEMIHYVKNFL